MLTGNPPYYADDIPTLYKNIAEGNLTFTSDVSADAKDLLRVKILNKLIWSIENVKSRSKFKDRN